MGLFYIQEYCCYFNPIEHNSSRISNYNIFFVLTLLLLVMIAVYCYLEIQFDSEYI